MSPAAACPAPGPADRRGPSGLRPGEYRAGRAVRPARGPVIRDARPVPGRLGRAVHDVPGALTSGRWRGPWILPDATNGRQAYLYTVASAGVTVILRMVADAFRPEVAFRF